MTPLVRLLKKSMELREKAHKEICAVALDAKAWRMLIPPQKDDSDVLLQSVLDESEAKDKIIETLVGALESAQECNALILQNSKCIGGDKLHVDGNCASCATKYVSGHLDRAFAKANAIAEEVLK